ncbi:hypothetical protein [Salinithrix halophila]|uniref:Uncharacterized protein n=1 Tax=Salinithrix halophila TaxID=1485204 RepID=A0ABV8JD88_9BACL
MQELFHCTQSCSQIQQLLSRIVKEVEKAYEVVVPYAIRQRRNTHLQKQRDAVIIAVHILGHMLGFTSERMWHQFVSQNLFLDQPFPERSRYHRRCRQLLSIIKWIRSRLIRLYSRKGSYGIIESLPIPLSHPARKYRAKRMREIADIGYCAAKKNTMG